MFDRFRLRRRLMSDWPAAAIATMIIMLVGCGTGTPPVEVPRVRIWRDKETEELLKLVAKSGNLYCYRYEGCFLEFIDPLFRSPMNRFHPDVYQKVLPGQATSRSGILVVVRTGKAQWEISSKERFSWEKVKENDATKRTVDEDELIGHLSVFNGKPGSSSGSAEVTPERRLFTLAVPEDLEVEFTKVDLGVTDYFKDSNEIPVLDEEPITLARFEIVGKDGKIHGGWDLRCAKVKPEPAEKTNE